jgi:hypothetical protein
MYLCTPDRMSFYAHLGWTEVEVRTHRRRTVSVMAYGLATRNTRRGPCPRIQPVPVRDVVESHGLVGHS